MGYAENGVNISERHLNLRKGTRETYAVRQVHVEGLNAAEVQSRSSFRDSMRAYCTRAVRADVVEQYAALLQECSEKRALSQGKKIHERIRKDGCDGDTFLGNLLVRMYGRCGSTAEAAAAFASIHFQNHYSWTLVISAHAYSGCCSQAFGYFHRMQLQGVRPNRSTLTSILAACSGQEWLQQGIWLHRLLSSLGYLQDVVIVSNLVSMYTKCGSITRAAEVFLSSQVRNVYTWTAMIGGLAQHGYYWQALRLFKEMQGVERPNKVTYLAVLGACNELLEEGISIHEQIVRDGHERDVMVGTAIVNMYGKCGRIDLAREAFDRMEQRNVVSWNAMITAYAQHGHCIEALELYTQMEAQGIQPDRITYLASLDACAGTGDLAQGRQIHSRLVAAGEDYQCGVGNTVLNMYGKCGSLVEARNTFDAMLRSCFTSIVSWNAIISAYAQNGYTAEALQIFKDMDPQGVTPDKVTFLNALFACSHAGMLDEARGYLVDMTADYGLSPRVDHYGAVLDLMARLGLLEAAQDLVLNMPFHPNDAVWLSLLGGYQVHVAEGQNWRNRKRCIVDRVVELDPENSAPYVMLSNMYSA